jgi:hypothetical protein
MITALDTSVLLDILVDDPTYADSSEEKLAKVFEQGSLIISPAVYAELVPQANDRQQLDAWLAQCGIHVPPLTADHAFTAGVAHAAYRKAGGRRQRILADFFIGAHALHEANQLLTRDRGFYRQYFSGLHILSAS